MVRTPTAAARSAVLIAAEVLREPTGGAHRSWDETASTVSKALVKELSNLSKMNAEEITHDRYEKFRAIGKFLNS